MAIDIVRAWKDPEYRKTLSPAELEALPSNPAGSGRLSDEEVAAVSGGLPVQHTAVYSAAISITGDNPVCGNSNQCGGSGGPVSPKNP